jgi:multidrug efflux system membrane fusion protein
VNCRTTTILLCLGVVSCGGLIGCRSTPETKADKKPECGVILPQSRGDIQDYVEYTGRTAAAGSVDVKARVTGFLKEVKFTEGTAVKKGEVLFLIDDVPYKAQLEQARAQVGLYKAQVDLTTRTYEQKLATRKKNPDTVTDLDLRTAEAQMKEAVAGLNAAKASLKIYELNDAYTTVKSPIDGVVGRKNQTPGNVVLQDQTLLTTVVSLDPIYVYFDMDAVTVAQFHNTTPGKAAPVPGALGSISLELPGNPTSASEGQTPRVPGILDFFNNQFNPATDTLLVRGKFRNPPQTAGAPRLRPGMFVRVKLSIGKPYRALLVPDRAILSKMGKKYVYVAGADNRVKEIPVTIGQLQEKGLRVIKGGQLKATDRVIATRLLDIQPNQEIIPVPLPSQPADGAGAGGQKSEIRSQRSEVRGQSREVAFCLTSDF